MYKTAKKSLDCRTFAANLRGGRLHVAFGCVVKPSLGNAEIDYVGIY